MNTKKDKEVSKKREKGYRKKINGSIYIPSYVEKK